TSVRYAEGSPTLGKFWMKSVAIGTLVHASSLSTPSIMGGLLILVDWSDLDWENTCPQINSSRGKQKILFSSMSLDLKYIRQLLKVEKPLSKKSPNCLIHPFFEGNYLFLQVRNHTSQLVHVPPLLGILAGNDDL